MTTAKKIKLLILGAGLMFFFLLSLHSAFALEVNYPSFPGTNSPQSFAKNTPPEEILGLYLKYIINLAIWLSVWLTALILVIAGIRYVISLGNPSGMISAKEQIKSAFLGLLILFLSSLILNALNPELTILKIGSLPKIQPIEKKYIPPFSSDLNYSLIYLELPFGRIIEKIFETYISEIPPKNQPKEEKPRMERIKENVKEILAIAEKLKKKSEKIKALSEQCSCAFVGIGPKGLCSSDPCASDKKKREPRKEIEKTQKESLEQIDLLKQTLKKTKKEIKDLKDWSGRLKRTETFLECKKEESGEKEEYCASWLKKSYSQFLSAKDGEKRQIKFWNDISVPYLNKKGKQISDWATIMFIVGGGKLSTTSPPVEEKQEPRAKEKACSAEIPIGDIIDRSERIAGLLIKKMEKLVELSEEMIKATDDFNVLISQCGSQPPQCLPRGGVCVGPACPNVKIKNQIGKIKKIFETDLKEKEQGIKNIIENSLPEKEKDKEKIGIIPLINPDKDDSLVSKLLQDLDNIEKLKNGRRGVRYPLQTCETKPRKDELLNCQSAAGRTGPEGKTIGVCCSEEPVFQQCLNKCYLEKGEGEYKKCLGQCLDQKSEEARKAGVPRPEEISRCRHLLNYFCCSI